MRPAELYRWVNGETVWTQTSADQAIEYEGETYEPIQIGRGDLSLSPDLARNSLSVKTTRSNPVALLHLTDLSNNMTTLTVFRVEGASGMTIWKGRIASAQSDGNEIELSCESIFTSLRRAGLRARYQRGCRHAIYRRGCNVNGSANQADHQVDGGATEISGAMVRVPVAANRADGRYTGGILRGPDGVERLIIRHVGEWLTLQTRVSSLTDAVPNAGWDLSWDKYWDGSVAVSIFPGCKHTREDCNTEFNNIENYGGFPWIPGKNPFSGSSIV